MLAIATKVVVLVVAIVDLSETVHVHLAHKRDCLLCVELIVWCLQVVGFEFVSIQVDSLAVLRPTQAVLNARIVYELPEFLRKQFLVLVHQEATTIKRLLLLLLAINLLLLLLIRCHHVLQIMLLYCIIIALGLIVIVVFCITGVVF